MKRFLFFVTALLFLGTAVAADKVIQSSAKRTPGWIGGMGEDYFIVSAEAPTLDEAQQKETNWKLAHDLLNNQSARNIFP